MLERRKESNARNSSAISARYQTESKKSSQIKSIIGYGVKPKQPAKKKIYKTVNIDLDQRITKSAVPVEQPEELFKPNATQ